MDTYIFGSGGFAKEINLLIEDSGLKTTAFVGEKQGVLDNLEILDEKKFNPQNSFNAIVGVGSPHLRKDIVQKLYNKFLNLVTFPNVIHPSSVIMGIKHKKVKMGIGTVICANCVLTSDIKIGDFAQLNLGTTIGHDSTLDVFFTSAPGVNISGFTNINELVYFGTNSSTREKINIANNVVIGAGSVVVSNILESGIYAGVPARRIKNG